jgi:threonine dehydrogenase-like Zn-dependent dehydrogenase
MKGIVFTDMGKAHVMDNISSPKLTQGDVLTKTRTSGVSTATELNFLTGGCYSQPWPIIPGYQNVGTVIEVIAEELPIYIGNRFYSHYWYRPVEFTYQSKSHTKDAGAHVEYREGPPVHPNLISLPEDIPDEQAALLSVVCIGLHGARRSGASVGKKVLVLELGLIGQFASQVARLLGACCHGFGRRQLCLDLAEKYACERVFSGRELDVWNQIKRESPYDIIIETTGNNEFIDRSLECLTGERDQER